MPKKIARQLLAGIHRCDGPNSRRSPAAVSVRKADGVRRAQAAYQKFGTLCFWSFRTDIPITAKNASWVVEQLRRNGNRAAWQEAARIQSLLAGHE
jgi:hypothetical protein